MALSKRVLAGISSGLFRFVSKREDVAETVRELNKTNREVLVSAGLAVVLSVTGLGFWQGLKIKSPLMTYLSCGGSLALIESAHRKNRKTELLKQKAETEKKVAHERELQRIVGTYMPDQIPHAITSGIGGNVVIFLKNYNIDAHHIGTIYAPQYVRVKVRLDSGQTVEMVNRLQKTMKAYLGVSQLPVISESSDENHVTIDAERKDREFIPIEKFLIPNTFMASGTEVSLPVGVNANGEMVYVKPSNPDTAHILIGGTTGSGKSELLLMWMRWLMQWRPEDVQVIVIDPKRVTFAGFEPKSQLAKMVEFVGAERSEVEQVFPELAEAEKFTSQYKAWLPWGVIKDPTEAALRYKEVDRIMHDRYSLFEQAGCSDFKTFNAAMRRWGLPTLPQVFVITDEYYMQVAVETNKVHTEDAMKRLGAMARAAGICLIIATQRPEQKVVTPMVRSMFSARLCMKVATTQDAEIIMGRPDEAALQGAYLFGKGDLIWLGGSGDIVRLQSPYWSGKSQPATLGDVAEINLAPTKEQIQAFRNKLEQTITVEAPAEDIPESERMPSNPTEFKYMSYRSHREEGLAPYKWHEKYNKPATRQKIDAFDVEVRGYFDQWIAELKADGMTDEAIVKHIWNMTEKNDKSGGERYREKLSFVRNSMGVK